MGNKGIFLVSGWIIAGLVTPVLALNDSISEKGVNALRLHKLLPIICWVEKLVLVK